MADNSKEQIALIINWIFSITVSILLGAMFHMYLETGHFFRLTGHTYEGILGSVIGIWLLGALLAKLMYNAQKQYDQQGGAEGFPKIKIPGKIFSDFYAPVIENFHKKNIHLDAKEKAYKIFRISIVVLGCVAMLAAFVLHWLGFSI